MKYIEKTILVTGASKGVGKMLVDYFLENGASVIGISKTTLELNNKFYFHYSADVSDSEQLQEIFKQIIRSKKKIDILINNAAVLTSQFALLMPVSSAKKMIDVNLFGAFLTIRESAKIMRKSKYGRIINITSMAVALEPICDNIYTATKAGLEVLNNILAKEFSGLNITCNNLAISAIETEMLNSLSKTAKEKIDNIIKKLPVPRYARIEDITNVIDFYCKEESGYITAQTIYLGGVHG